MPRKRSRLHRSSGGLSRKQLEERLTLRQLSKATYQWCIKQDVPHIVHLADQDGGCCSVCRHADRFIGIGIRLDCNYEPTELLHELQLDLRQGSHEISLPEGLCIGHIVVPPGSVILAPRGLDSNPERLGDEHTAEIPIRCGTVEEILECLYCYYHLHVEQEGDGCCRMKGLLKLDERLYTPNLC
ncbi:hypothetical protein DM02DRAFT_664764 [Periconia macrospinosa]|uniref:Uncharacterized protein n=1 Tax=Periconia macrospinosa TaxID=97972 RepID=A0A2V1CZR6_9PLEO|nr:hypothetical protein DM02DRAFT_664764 [Periconia macrospinosa]